MDYQEYSPPTALARWIQCLWHWKDPNPGAWVQTIYPDGRCELIVHLGTPLGTRGDGKELKLQPACIFSAQQRCPIRLFASGPVDCIGIRLRPAASNAMSIGDLAALRDRIVDYNLANPALARAAVRQVRNRTPDSILDGLDQWLGPALRGFLPDPGVEGAATLIDEAGGQIRVAEVARQTGLGLRHLQSLFLAQVGLTVKEYQRITRLQAALKYLDRGGSALAYMAADCGFSDQPHATRELRRMTGHTPARLAKALADHRDDESTLRLAAAFIRGRDCGQTSQTASC